MHLRYYTFVFILLLLVILSLGSWGPILIMKCPVENEINTSVALVSPRHWFMDVAPSSNNGVFISLKSGLLCEALISTTCDMPLSGSGLIRRQNKVKGCHRELSDSFKLIKVTSWAGLCSDCLLCILVLRGLTSLVRVRRWISSLKDSHASKFSNYMPPWKENIYDYGCG